MPKRANDTGATSSNAPVSITKRFINQLVRPGKGEPRASHWDSQLKGFGLAGSSGAIDRGAIEIIDGAIDVREFIGRVAFDPSAISSRSIKAEMRDDLKRLHKQLVELRMRRCLDDPLDAG
jgi:hypothetical protein